MEDLNSSPEMPAPLCRFCRQTLTNIAWRMDPESGLTIFFHNQAACMTALNCQLLPVQKRMVELPAHLVPRGRG